MNRLLWSCGLLIAFSGCNCGGKHEAPTDGGQDTVVCLSDAQSIALSPLEQSVTLSNGVVPPIQLTATETSAAGATRDVTRLMSWTVTRDDDTPPGSMTSAGTYQPASGNGGKISVHAEDLCGHSADATINLRLEATFATPVPEVVARFDGPSATVVSSTNASGPQGAKLPMVVYPSSETRFPRNIFKVLFQWNKGSNDQFRLTFEGAGSKTVIYTDGVHPTCADSPTSACWEADQTTWLAIAGSNAGTTVTLKVDGSTVSDPNVYQSDAITLGFSKKDVKGAIFYWSTTSAGIRRAAVADSAPEPYVVGKPVGTVLNNGSTVQCVACHTVSRSGKKLFGGTKTSTTTGGFVFDVTLDPPPTPVVTIGTQNKAFGTFSPDDTRVVVTTGSTLAEFDAATGAKIINLPPAAGTNPDWSPLGTELVYSNKGGDSPGSAGLDVIPYNSGVWGTVRPLVAAAGLSNLFPSYSPDGAYVAYARGKGGHGDKTLQLWLAKADGAQSPIELKVANRVVNNTTTQGQYENNMPTWAPPGDLDWVAFNSLRPYGVVFPTGGTQQIWVAAIDRSKLSQGIDPSYPAFRFAFQDLNENNHRAFWTLDVRQPLNEGFTEVPGGGNDGGTCLNEGQSCSQTSGSTCCSPLVCDDPNSSGATTCRIIIN